MSGARAALASLARRALPVLGFLGAVAPAEGQRAASPPPGSSAHATPASGTLAVYLVTVGQGGQVWEKFGHNALWFVDSAAGVDVAYNWGIFDFAQPGFVRRFLTGDTRYWVEGYPGGDLVDFYIRSDRAVVLQRLAFTPEQAARALEFSRWNAREENKYYRYDYYRDNCSTRVRDVIDLALGGALRAATDSVRTPLTYRSESLRLVDDLAATQLGMHIALGQPADRPLTTWETMFIPMRMRDALRDARASDGGRLVSAERLAYESRTHRERPDRARVGWPYLIAGLLIAAQLVLSSRASGSSPAARGIFLVESTVWAFVTGFLGLAVLLAWTSTQHVFWYRNENLLLLNPLALWLAALLPFSVRRERLRRAAAILAVVIAMLSAVALMLKGLPWFRQDNLAVIGLVLPIHFAVAYGLWTRARPADRRDHESGIDGAHSRGLRGVGG